MPTALVIGASGTVGSQIVQNLDRESTGLVVRLATSRPETAAKWQQEGREAVVLDLEKPETFAQALDGVDRLFLLTGYTAAMLYQSKMLVDAAVAARVSHIVHLGVFSSGRDHIPHFTWHDLIETYIQASGIAWTNIHPNVILDSLLVTNPPVTKTKSFRVMWGAAALGWISAYDIAAVSAAVLREGPEKHGGANYSLSPEILTGVEAAGILTEEMGTQITCDVGSSADLASYIESIPDIGTRMYMESALQTMKQGESGKMVYQARICDDVQTVLGRPATTLREWVRMFLVA
jgi:NAD(P)H dehydrogenase (quinone)